MDKSKKEFDEAINTIKKRGFVCIPNINPNKAVIKQYNFNTKSFDTVSKDRLMDLFGKLYLNSYNVDYNFISVSSALNRVSNSNLKNYDTYREYEQQEFDFIAMEQLKTLLLKKNNSKKKDIKPFGWRLSEQIQCLINADVFVDDGKFYQYTNDRFQYVPVDRLISVFKNQPYIENVSAMRVAGNRNHFLKYLTNANGLIQEYYAYNMKVRIMSETEKDFNKISSLTSTFE